jgi:hypothetical protein
MDGLEIHQLSELEPLEISLVDRAANRRPFLMLKSNKQTSDIADGDISMFEKIKSKIIKDDSLDKEIEVIIKEEAEKEVVSEDEAKPAEEAIVEAKEADAEAEAEEEVKDEEPAEEKVEKAEDALEAAPQDLKEELEKMKKAEKTAIEKADKLEKLLKKEVDEKEDKMFLQKAEQFSYLPIAANDFGLILKSAYHSLPEKHFEALESVLKAANKNSEAFLSEEGSSAPVEAKSAKDQLDEHSRRIAKEDKVSFHQGFAKASKEYPELLQHYND